MYDSYVDDDFSNGFINDTPDVYDEFSGDSMFTTYDIECTDFVSSPIVDPMPEQIEEFKPADNNSFKDGFSEINIVESKPEEDQIIYNENFPIKNKKHRQRLDKKTLNELNKWIYTHSSNPYPTQKEKREMCDKYNISMDRLNVFFVNQRRRLLGKLIFPFFKNTQLPRLRTINCVV